ncbi:hypothetical protein [Spiribacter vilamensis]|uniref:Lipoprotein n=1 Tax=Spiribacter vilamensis TaxID=531306 RepID=A0A4V6MHG3_9GAMM|nr:hypothetical protein [Spiribacter vilamensis]RZU98745.1 hypothetical protein EV698_1006 [Spiribacter vilamensis]TVO62232.1 hypothetical protein FPL09_09185 [Spiribacter vilamensis]
MQGLRKWKLGRIATMGMVAVLLAGCKADEVEIDLAIEQLKAVAAGEEVTAEFEAVFSNIGELDDEQRAQVGAVEDILTQYMSVDDFELERTDLGFEVTVEGELPVLGVDRADHAYYLSVTESASLPGYHRVSFETGDDFARMEGEMSAINFMLSPDAYHPTKFRLDGRSSSVLAPAAEVNGRSYLLYDAPLEDRVRLIQKGGAFDSTGAGFFVRLDG